MAYWASPESAFLEEIVRAAATESGDKLLDVGCGAGNLLALIAAREPGAMLYGIDPDSDALELASRKIRGTVAGVELHEGFGESLPFPDDFFDVVCATLLLSRIRRTLWPALLAEAARVLRPGGRLLIADWAQAGGLAGQLWRLPSKTARAVFTRDDDVSRFSQVITDSGFHRPDSVETLPTLLGSIELVEVHKRMNPPAHATY